jgi:spore germination protein YaaH
MTKRFFLLITFCLFVFINIYSAPPLISGGHGKAPLTLMSPNQQKDTSARINALKKIKGFKLKDAENITAKENPVKKKKLDSFLYKLLKPIRFRANERTRVTRIIRDYINDSTTTAADLKSLRTELLAMNSRLSLLKLRLTLDSIKNHTLHDTVRVIYQTGKEGTAPKDSMAKEKSKEPAIAGSQQFPGADKQEKQKKLNLIGTFYNTPLRVITDTSKKQDSLITKLLSIGHKGQVLGFYADTSRTTPINFQHKLFTTLVYASNQIEDPSGNLTGHTSVIDSARKYDCDIILSIYNNKPESISGILKKNSDKKTLIERSIKLLTKTHATGININFNGLDQTLQDYFLTFIESLYEACQRTPEHFKISITVPADDKCRAYDLARLDRFTQYFIIDFSKKTNSAGALAPLDNGSDNSVETCFSFYLDQSPPIAAAKFILGVSYSGVVWQKQPEKFLHYIPYNTVRANYSDAAVTHKKGESAAYIEADHNRALINIWYEDENTLGEKYDFALNSTLGGIAIKSLGDDNGYGELEDELAYKYIKIDTCILSTSNRKASFDDFFRLWIRSPCGEYINPEYNKILMWLNICNGLILIIVAWYRYHCIKKIGSGWGSKRPVTYILVGLSGLEAIMLLLLLFFSTENKFFGPSNTSTCINISFIVLLLILIAGIGAGMVIWSLIQLNYKVDKP